MPAKRGRPVSDAPKDYMLRVRMDQETLQQLDECCEAKNLSRSEIVRKGIKVQPNKKIETARYRGKSRTVPIYQTKEV